MACKLGIFTLIGSSFVIQCGQGGGHLYKFMYTCLNNMVTHLLVRSDNTIHGTWYLL